MFSDWLAFFWQQIEQIGAVQPGIFNIPWLFVVLQPLRILGKYPALFLVQAVSLFVVFRLCREFKLSTVRTVLVFLSAPVFWNFFMGQIDGILLGAYLLPPAWAALLALFKPQTNLWAGWDAVKKKPMLLVLVVILVISAFLIWRWPLSVKSVGSGMVGQGGMISSSLMPTLLVDRWNWSLWPYGILLIPLVFLKEQPTGMFLSPLVFPYAGLQSLIGPIIAAAVKAPAWLFGLLWLLLWLRWAWMLKLI